MLMLASNYILIILLYYYILIVDNTTVVLSTILFVFFFFFFWVKYHQQLYYPIKKSVSRVRFEGSRSLELPKFHKKWKRYYLSLLFFPFVFFFSPFIFLVSLLFVSTLVKNVYIMLYSVRVFVSLFFFFHIGNNSLYDSKYRAKEENKKSSHYISLSW